MANVVFQTAFIGDLLLAIPLLRAVKRLYPAEPLILVCRPGLGEFFVKTGLADDVIELDKKSKESIAKFSSRLNQYDLRYLFCLHESFRTAWILRSIRAQKVIGFSHWWNKYLFDTRVRRPMNLPEPLRALFLLTPLHRQIKETIRGAMSGSEVPLNSVLSWKYQIPEEFSAVVKAEARAQLDVTARLDIKKPFAVLAPASQWATKRWTPSGYAELAAELADRGLNVYVVGTRSEKSQADEIVDQVPRQEREIRNIAGETSLVDLHALMSQAEVIVANDSGPMHMATVAGRPVIGIFGPTTLDLGYRPWSNHSAVIQKALPCRPCGKHGHQTCPIGTHECMRRVTTAEVLSGVSHLLKHQPTK